MVNNNNGVKKLIIVGASGHGKVIADIALLNGYQDIVFLDDNESLISCGEYPVVGTTSKLLGLDGDIFVAIGDASIRKSIYVSFQYRDFPALIHPDAIISNSAVIGEGTVVMAGSVINPYATIGSFCIVNTSSSIDHDCFIKDFAHVSVGAHLCGSVVIGRETWVGAGATIINNVEICDGCTIGAGALVIKDIKERGTYVGVPAKKL